MRLYIAVGISIVNSGEKLNIRSEGLSKLRMTWKAKFISILANICRLRAIECSGLKTKETVTSISVVAINGRNIPI